MIAIIEHFDKEKGTGLAAGLNGKKYIIQACDIPGAKTESSSTSCVFYNVCEVIELFKGKPLTKGQFDRKKWWFVNSKRGVGYL